MACDAIATMTAKVAIKDLTSQDIEVAIGAFLERRQGVTSLTASVDGPVVYFNFLFEGKWHSCAIAENGNVNLMAAYGRDETLLNEIGDTLKTVQAYVNQMNMFSALKKIAPNAGVQWHGETAVITLDV